MRDLLRISDDLELPAEAVTETFAMLAKRGTGKSNAAVVMAEEMWRLRLPWVAIDPKGDWWGIRSDRSGNGPGLPIPVFGGRHGDLPLEHTAGALTARLVLERDMTCVLDVSEFTKGEQVRFVTDFAQTLFRLIKVDPRPLHLFLEEAEEFLPQMTRGRGGGSEAPMVGAYSKIAKQGRAFGLGVTLITQRSASISKDALSQTESLILFRTTSPHDKRAVVDWVDDPAVAKEVMATLPSLAPGEAWILSPGFLGATRRFQWKRRTTFDSGATPVAGQRRREPASLADIDLGEIKDLMADTIEKAKEQDPAELRKRIQKLERDLATEKAIPPAPADPVEVPIVPPEFAEAIARATDVIEETTRRFDAALHDLRSHLEQAGAFVKRHNIAERAATTRPAPHAAQPSRRTATATSDGTLTKAERAVLTVLAQFPAGRTKTQIALLSGYSIKSSSLANAIGALRSKGYATKGDPTCATSDGVEALGDHDPLPSGDALRDHWMRSLGKAERTILQVLIDYAPGEVERHLLAQESGYSATSSSFANALGKLRSLDLVEGWRLHPDFEESIS